MMKPAHRRGDEASCPYVRIISSFACCNARPLSIPAANLEENSRIGLSTFTRIFLPFSSLSRVRANER
jgi:hypothetical protein